MENLGKLQSQIVARAWEDPHFRSQLVSDPKGALMGWGGEYAAAASEIQNIRVIADTEETIHLVLPMSPINSDDVSEAFLEQLGASNADTMKGPNCATKSYTKPCSRECK